LARARSEALALSIVFSKFYATGCRIKFGMTDTNQTLHFITTQPLKEGEYNHTKRLEIQLSIFSGKPFSGSHLTSESSRIKVFLTFFQADTPKFKKI
jgi:hypothetical protein